MDHSYSIHVRNLTVCAPPTAWKTPLFTVPVGIQRTLGGKARAAEKSKPIIRSISLEVNPGETLAILGGSGSGKTTLLNSLACRFGNLSISSGELSYASNDTTTTTPNRISVSSHASHNARHAKQIIGFVRQDDFLLPYLTVRETLTFAAALRLPAGLSFREREETVQDTLEELGLADVANVVVGGPFHKGISGGEKRRLSIGCVLVAQPTVLILDEPTTGLDAYSAHSLLKTLSALSRRGRAVVVSIHQPRSDAFQLFDRTVLLSAGDLVYSGTSARLLPYFARHGYTPQAHVNPLDFIIDISSLDTRSKEAETESHARVKLLKEAWKEEEEKIFSSKGNASGNTNNSKQDGKDNTTTGTLLSDGMMISSQPTQMSFNAEELDVSSAPFHSSNRSSLHPGWFTQTRILTHRSCLNVFRNYGQLVGFLLQSLLISVVLGLTYYKPPETLSGIQTLKTIVYMNGPSMFYLSILVSIFIHTRELVVFDREQEDDLYAVPPYVIGSFLSYLPSNVVCPSIFAIIVYFMCGFWKNHLATKMFSFIAQCILQQLASWSYGIMCASFSRSYPVASMIGNALSITFFLTSGYVIPVVPVWVRWLRWISPYFYGYMWMMREQFLGRVFACTNVPEASRALCDGETIMRNMNMSISSALYIYPLGLVGFVVVCQLIATVVLTVYHPGGVRYAASPSPTVSDANAAKKSSSSLGEATSKSGSSVLDEERGAFVGSPQRLDVAIRDLSLQVHPRRWGRRSTDFKVILDRVSAFFPAGKVSVVMGPSGAGKSSLLQLLARSLSPNYESTGDVFLNGTPYASSMDALIAFVEQDDWRHLSSLTVRETLRYAARLRLRGARKTEAYARAEEVIRMLGLRPCADTLVGGEVVKGISGGEKRRLSLAVQLLSDPAILVADEPLSGLDAYIALNVFTYLKQIAATGRTIIVTVHQPRSDIWNLFDHILLLASGGRPVYSGPSARIIEYFSAAGHPCPVHYNPADFILDTIAVKTNRATIRAARGERLRHEAGNNIDEKGAGKSVAGRANSENDSNRDTAGLRVTELHTSEKSGDLEAGLSNTSVSSLPLDVETQSRETIKALAEFWRTHAAEYEISPATYEKSSIPTAPGIHASPFLTAFPVVVSRSWKNLRRQQDVASARFLNPPITVLIMWIFFARLNNNPESAQIRIGAVQETSALPYIGVISCAAIYPSERNLFLYEHKSIARYSVATFILSYTLQEILFSLVSTLVYSIIFVYGYGLQSSGRILVEFWISSFALLNFGESVGLAFNTYFSDGGLAISLVSGAISMLAGLNGVVSVTIPQWLNDIGWISVMKPAAWIVTINEMHGLVFNCDPNHPEKCTYSTGDALLQVFGLPLSGTGKYIGILFAQLFILRFCSYIALYVKSRII